VGQCRSAASEILAGIPVGTRPLCCSHDRPGRRRRPPRPRSGAGRREPGRRCRWSRTSGPASWTRASRALPIPPRRRRTVAIGRSVGRPSV
jgi:hypothetical protein